MFFCVCVSAGATSRTAPPASGHLDSIKTTSSLNTNRPEGNKRFFGSDWLLGKPIQESWNQESVRY